jgi:hypothetical protein
MDLTLGTRLRHAWNAFRANDEDQKDTGYQPVELGFISMQNPNRVRLSGGNEKSIIAGAYNRIAMDAASFDIQHIKVDQNGRYIETVNDSLNQCLSIEANKDQTGRGLIHDAVMSMFDEGVVAIIPVETTIDPRVFGSYEINSLRVGKILEWYPNHIRVELYDDRVGIRKRLLVPKSIAAIVENPLYPIINEPNSIYKRLVRKLNMLDCVDEVAGPGKIDLIIQLPYTIKSEARRMEAEKRRKQIEEQLRDKKYGVAYTDGTERVIQLNRPVENNLLQQVQYLTQMLFNQLGLTEAVFNGTADERAMRNYYDRTIEPIVLAIIEEMRRKFLTKTARSQGHTIAAFRDMLKLVPANELAEIADKFSRNEILTANELRQVLGFKPSKAPQADELRNKNMPREDTDIDPSQYQKII